jgi:hypothetical protein
MAKRNRNFPSENNEHLGGFDEQKPQHSQI